MERMKRWFLLIFLLSFIFVWHPIKGMQEAKEKANREGRMILENIDGYAQKAEMAAQRSERACFNFMRELLQKGRSGEIERSTESQKEQVKERTIWK